MKKNFGYRVLAEHGLLSNIIEGLSLVDLIKLANICRRTYIFTVSWNMSAVAPPKPDCQNSFPLFNDISPDIIYKSTEDAIIDKCKGNFYGPFNRMTNQPDGYGVFTTSVTETEVYDKTEYKHYVVVNIDCGNVKNGYFSDGRRVILSKKQKSLLLMNTKYLPDGSLLQKVEKLTL